MLSIVVPTYNEGENVFLVARRVREVLAGMPYELVFVDDSTDDTPVRLEQLVRSDPRVRYEHRAGERGLGTAVVRGFQMATGTVLAVMDADLQHPPEMLLPMLAAVRAGAEVVLPSRFIPGGDDGGLSPGRKLVSAAARYLGKIVLRSLRSVSDPTGGYFMLRRSVIKGVQLRPVGWKILIEVLVRGSYDSVLELPYRFRSRSAGESKMSLREQWNYLRHLGRLARECPRERRLYAFGLVGLTGVLVNMAAYWSLVRLGMNVAASGTLSALLAMLGNFILNDTVTWPDIRPGPQWIRFAKYALTSAGGIAIDIALLGFLYYLLRMPYLPANLIGIAAGFGWNYTVNTAWTWRAQPGKTPVPRRMPFVQGVVRGRSGYDG